MTRIGHTDVLVMGRYQILFIKRSFLKAASPRDQLCFGTAMFLSLWM